MLILLLRLLEQSEHTIAQGTREELADRQFVVVEALLEHLERVLARGQPFGLAQLLEIPCHELRDNEPAIEERRHTVSRIARELGPLRPAAAAIDLLYQVIQGVDHRRYTVAHAIAGIHRMIGPPETLERPYGRRTMIAGLGIVVLKSDAIVEH